VSAVERNRAERAVETVARNSYGRLVAYLSARSRDVAAAEDALADAFVAALRTWPADGVPGNPEAWLLTAARRKLIDRARHEKVRAGAVDDLQHLLERTEEMSLSSQFPDERLKLLFVCAHPAVDAAVHTPLMLQTVLGLDAATVARAFLVAPTTMGQRLSRAKTKIRDARIGFDVPDGHELAPRLGAVLEAIYAAYGSGWDDVTGVDPRRRGLADEAIWLARMLLDLMPGEAEAQGLLAMMLYCEARRPARRSADGRYVPLSEQDPSLWSKALFDEADRTLTSAAKQIRPGRFQLEAAVQSAHMDRARTGRIDWPAVALLYEGLVRGAPTIGALVGRAAAVAEAGEPAASLAQLDRLPLDAVRSYAPYWATRAHILRRLGRTPDALEAFDRAIDLSDDEAVRQFLRRRRDSGSAAGC
jgi:predicted RNA polymerase sigma factor